MPEQPNDLTVYNNMETQYLEQLLREDAQGTGQPLDSRALLHITGLLAQRKQMPSSDSAWEDFQQHYRKDRSPVRERSVMLCSGGELRRQWPSCCCCVPLHPSPMPTSTAISTATGASGMKTTSGLNGPGENGRIRTPSV